MHSGTICRTDLQRSGHDEDRPDNSPLIPKPQIGRNARASIMDHASGPRNEVLTYLGKCQRGSKAIWNSSTLSAARSRSSYRPSMLKVFQSVRAADLPDLSHA